MKVFSLFDREEKSNLSGGAGLRVEFYSTQVMQRIHYEKDTAGQYVLDAEGYAIITLEPSRIFRREGSTLPRVTEPDLEFDQLLEFLLADLPLKRSLRNEKAFRHAIIEYLRGELGYGMCGLFARFPYVEHADTFRCYLYRIVEGLYATIGKDEVDYGDCAEQLDWVITARAIEEGYLLDTATAFEDYFDEEQEDSRARPGFVKSEVAQLRKDGVVLYLDVQTMARLRAIIEDLNLSTIGDRSDLINRLATALPVP